ncbi:MAG: 30S ribosomal protein S6 [Deltaproteobacteria bacterium]|nr:30S ribosomal protein S6 [Deltaproteobacteria bacterium]
MSEVVRKYELIYIHPGNLPSEDVEAVDEILNGILEHMAGELLHREDWGVRALAYPVQKHAEGRYILLRIACPADCLKEIERRFKITESVIKFLSIRLPDDYVQEVIPEEPEVAVEEAAEEVTEKAEEVAPEASEEVTEGVSEEENVEEAREEGVEVVAEEAAAEVEAARSSDDAEDENPGEE